MKNAINWFEIPVKDLKRAKKFYETVTGSKMQEMEAMGMKSAFFEFDMKNGIGGCIIEGKGYSPSKKGSVVYLNGGDDLSKPLAKVSKAGGKVTLPKTSLGPNGFMAKFEDTEGNQVAFHSMK